MSVVSKSKIEYVTWGINWRTGCCHDCTYCYQHGAADRFSRLMPSSGDWSKAEDRIEDPETALMDELHKRTLRGVIMVSTSHDPAMDDVCAKQSRDVVRALGRQGLLHHTLYLTKAPNRALDALHSAGAAEGLRFGTTLTSMGVGLTATYEPDTERPEHRLAGLRYACALDYSTWVSLEPPLPDVYLHRLVEVILEQAGRPWIVLGKLNTRGATGEPEEDLARWARSDHWAADRDKAVALLELVGYRESRTPVNGGYWVKKELRDA